MRLATSSGHTHPVGQRRDQTSVAVGRRVEGRDVDPFDARQDQPERLTVAYVDGQGRPLAHGLVDVADDLLTVAEGEDVDEVRQRLGIEGAVATRR